MREAVAQSRYTSQLLSWFASLGERYIEKYLSPENIDRARLLTDECYGLQQFLYRWAYERSGAPRGFRIAAVKAVAHSWPNTDSIPASFLHFYHGPPNRRLNPALDPRLAALRVPAVVQQVHDSNVRQAFISISVNGVAHKIKSFFIRDLISLYGVDVSGFSAEDHLYCQPIDIWIRETVGNLTLPQVDVAAPKSVERLLALSPADLDAATRLIAASLDAGVSPLKVNQGIWYFCSNAIGDRVRLGEVLAAGNLDDMHEELRLIADFMP